MKNRVVGLLVVVLLFSFAFSLGCSNSDDTQREQMIANQIGVLEKELNGMEQQQAKLKESLQVMRAQLDTMEQEIDRMDPKVFAAKGTLDMLRVTVLTNESSLGWLMGNLELSIYLLVAVMILWLFYRLRHKKNQHEV